MKHSGINILTVSYWHRVSQDGVGETQQMEEKLQDTAGRSSCTISNTGMSTVSDGDEHDGSRHIYPAWGGDVHLERDMRSGTPYGEEEIRFRC